MKKLVIFIHGTSKHNKILHRRCVLLIVTQANIYIIYIYIYLYIYISELGLAFSVISNCPNWMKFGTQLPYGNPYKCFSIRPEKIFYCERTKPKRGGAAAALGRS